MEGQNGEQAAEQAIIGGGQDLLARLTGNLGIRAKLLRKALRSLQRMCRPRILQGEGRIRDRVNLVTSKMIFVCWTYTETITYENHY